MKPRSESWWRCSRSAVMKSSSEAHGIRSESGVPARGRLLGLDYGTKRVGLALSNIDQTIATPLETYLRRDQRQDERYLLQKVQEFGVAGIERGRLGHKRGGEGREGPGARSVWQ